MSRDTEEVGESLPELGSLDADNSEPIAKQEKAKGEEPGLPSLEGGDGNRVSTAAESEDLSIAPKERKNDKEGKRKKKEKGSDSVDVTVATTTVDSTGNSNSSGNEDIAANATLEEKNRERGKSNGASDADKRPTGQHEVPDVKLRKETTIDGDSTESSGKSEGKSRVNTKENTKDHEKGESLNGQQLKRDNSVKDNIVSRDSSNGKVKRRENKKEKQQPLNENMSDEKAQTVLSPTPPRSRRTSESASPNKGSRNTKHVVLTTASSHAEDPKFAKQPTSPRARPRNQPVQRARTPKGCVRRGSEEAQGGGGGPVKSGGGGGDAATGGGGKKKSAAAMVSFAARGRSGAEEYVLDEDRTTPRGGIFAKIPGLDQRLASEAKRITEPPRFREPRFKSGMTRKYDADEASKAASRYPECRGTVFRPSHADDGSYEDLPASSPLLSEPDHRLRLEHVRGYHGSGFYPSTENNAFFLGENRKSRQDQHQDTRAGFEVVYPLAALVVMQRFSESKDAFADEDAPEQEQRFFDGHTDDVTALAVHPGGVIVASGQVGKNAEVLVWDSSQRCQIGGRRLVQAGTTLAVLGGHQRKVCCLDFSHDGWLLCSVGADNHGTATVWDWIKGEAIATAHVAPCQVNSFRFNPYQAYGVPSEGPAPGQAPHIDDACYCMVSIGVRHAKFWLLTRGYDDNAREIDEPLPASVSRRLPGARRDSNSLEQKAIGASTLAWIMDGASARLNGKGEMADFTCMAFIDDSPPLQKWDSGGEVVDVHDESDRSSGRVVLGTATGDLYVFLQSGVRLVPREFAEKVKGGEGGGSDFFVDPWWLVGPGHEVTANKRLWDLGAELIDNIPRSIEAANKVILSSKAKEKLLNIERKLAVQSLHPAVVQDLKSQQAELQYSGQLSGHTGAVTALAFNLSSGKVVSGGANGEVIQWQAFFVPGNPLTEPASATASNTTPDTAEDEGKSKSRTRPITPTTSMVGAVNATRDRKDAALQESLTNPRKPRLVRMGDDPARGDGRAGGRDAFELDYKTTLARERGGELSLPGLTPIQHVVPAVGEGGGEAVGGIPLAVGTHCKSLVWSSDGKRLLAGVSTNALLVVEYPPDDSADSPDRRAAAVSPRGNRSGATTAGSGDAPPSYDSTAKPTVTCLVRGHHGSVLALGVFPGIHEYVTAGHDRSVILWDAESKHPLARCSLPHPVSCLACSPCCGKVVVGTASSNEILILKVHRRPDDGVRSVHSAEAPTTATTTTTTTTTTMTTRTISTTKTATTSGQCVGLELCRTKDLIPASAFASRWQPGPPAPGLFSGAACGKIEYREPAGSGTSYGTSGGSGREIGHISKRTIRHSNRNPFFKSPAASSASPGRSRASSISDQRGMGLKSGNLNVEGDHPYPPSTKTTTATQKPHKPQQRSSSLTRSASKMSVVSSATFGDRGAGGGAWVGGEREGGGRGSDRRFTGASCMRFSPSGSHLAIGCKNGALVVMAVEGFTPVIGGRGERGPDKSGSTGESTGGGGDSRSGYRRIAHLKGHSSRILHLDWTVDGRSLQTCGQDYHLLYWEISRPILPTPAEKQQHGGGSASGHGGHGSDSQSDDRERGGGAVGRGDQWISGDGGKYEDFTPRLFHRGYLMRDAEWATWSCTLGWAVQGIFPAYSDNTEVNAVDLCPSLRLLAAADDAKTTRLLRYPVLRGGARARAYTAHSSHVISARFTVGVEPVRLITIGGLDSAVMQWAVEPTLTHNEL